MILILAAAVWMAPAEWQAQHGSAAQDAAVQREGRASVRIEAGAAGSEALVRGRQMSLKVGQRYKLEGWLKTQGLTVGTGDRSSVPTGAALSMASMPWDMHTTSLAGTRGWTRVSMEFTATRALDTPQVRIAPGASFTGAAWVEGVSVVESKSAPAWPSKVAVRGFGPAYRYPRAGWIYLHTEGQPHERGFQHGYLMADEIAGYLDRCAAQMNAKDRELGWRQGRAIADAVFLRGFDQEILSEMQGIAEGAAAAGAKYKGRKLDLTDIVFANTIKEIGLLWPAAKTTQTGLEGLGLTPPSYFKPQLDAAPTDRCSAFAATGKATRDGKMVIGHITFWPLTLAEQTNVLLDVKPAQGHRMLMQSYPGGIQSGTDWYQNDAGVVLTETTIRQSPFNVNGTPVAFRARKAIQYGSNVEEVVRHLAERNNGLYTNEWMIADAKNDEIAMFELGTNKTKLWRSSRNEWFGGTEGFYWGCNNAKDLQVRLEHAIDPQGRPVHVPFQPSARDLKWQEMYRKHKGSIDEGFAFESFRTPPLVSASAFDAKVTSSEMAPRMMMWALLGKPNEREWVPSRYQVEQYAENEGIHSSGYQVWQAHASTPESAQAAVSKAEPKKSAVPKMAQEKLWKGWILPATEQEEWISLGAAAWYRIYSSQKPDETFEILVRRARESEVARKEALATLEFDAIRREMGDDAFAAMLRGFFERYTTKTIREADFPAARRKIAAPAHPPLLLALLAKLDSAVIVYGTDREAGANRHTAELLQSQFNRFFERQVPVLRDFELTPEIGQSRTIVFVGRPETNSAVRGEFPAKFDGAAFALDGKTYAHERDGVACAAENPLNSEQMVVLVAGNSAVETVRHGEFDPEPFTCQVSRRGKTVLSIF
ncbi:MAG: hypothetical protein HY821_21445 [Acidobacteria bacterium]|nr:hypothetical protein [Acidobacteriota bacterium]